MDRDTGPPFRDRRQAGRFLAARLQPYAERPDVLVLGLPRGGIPVAYEVAQALRVPLDVFVVRKLGYPGQEELAMGAIATGGVRVLNAQLARDVPPDVIDATVERERHELERRQRQYRGDRPPLDVKGRTVILVDDGLATGASMRAAVAALRQLAASRIVAAVPVAAQLTCDELRQVVDDVVCASTPEPFLAVGLWYENFDQTSDEEVAELLRMAQKQSAAVREPVHDATEVG